MLDSLVPVLLVLVLSGAVVEAEDVNLVASFTAVVGVEVGAGVVCLIPAALELGA